MFLNAKLEAPKISSQFRRSQHVLDLGRAHAGGERAADEAAHARAGGDVDRDVMLLEPADDADVRDAARAAAAEGDADGGPRFLRGARDRKAGHAHDDGGQQDGSRRRHDCCRGKTWAITATRQPWPQAVVSMSYGRRHRGQSSRATGC